MHLISEIPDPAAYLAYRLTIKAADAANEVCWQPNSWSIVLRHYIRSVAQGSEVHGTYCKHQVENIVDDSKATPRTPFVAVSI